MVREISAGGVVIRKKDGEWWMAAIELPTGPPTSAPKPASVAPARHAGRRNPKPVHCLPKGLVDPG